MPEGESVQSGPATALTPVRPVTVALDAMGGDRGVDAVVPGAHLVLQERPNVRFLFYGDESCIRPVLEKYHSLASVSVVHHTDISISNDEKPSVALRRGRESSMRKAIDAVSKGPADGVVSSGNTGALMAMAKMSLRTMPIIHRPAIASVFPTSRRPTVVLDLGANIQADAETLVQYAVLGCVYARILYDNANPSVGVLNVGSEEMKGHEHVRNAANILSRVEFAGRYYGFVEGDDIPKGTVDVVVTDGFTGNIALKMAEGVATFIGDNIKQAFSSGILSRLGYLCAAPALGRMKKSLDPRFYNGGIFMGLNGICLKSHGGSDDYAFSRAVLRAVDLIENDFNNRAIKEIEKLVGQESFFSLDHEVLR